MKFYKTTIVIEVLSDDEPFVFESLEQLRYEISDGNSSGFIGTDSIQELTLPQFLDECGKHNSEPEFFINEFNVDCATCLDCGNQTFAADDESCPACGSGRIVFPQSERG